MLPFSACTIQMNADCVVLTIITEDVKIKFDGKKTVMVSMNRVGSPAVTGLCGNHNSDHTGELSIFNSDTSYINNLSMVTIHIMLLIHVQYKQCVNKIEYINNKLNLQSNYQLTTIVKKHKPTSESIHL